MALDSSFAQNSVSFGPVKSEQDFDYNNPEVIKEIESMLKEDDSSMNTPKEDSH